MPSRTSSITLAIALLLLTPLGGRNAARADEVRVGDTRETVQTALGTPRGYISDESREILFYDRGRVELKDGLVVFVGLLSAEEAEAQRLEQQRLAKAKRQAAQLRHAELWAEGEQVREQRLSSTEFLAAAPSARVAFWREFRKRYPGVPVGGDYEVALREMELELGVIAERKETERRIASLENRVRDAEERARRAEEQATLAQSRPTFWGAGVPVAYSTYRSRPRYNTYCPPVATPYDKVRRTTTPYRRPTSWHRAAATKAYCGPGVTSYGSYHGTRASASIGRGFSSVVCRPSSSVSGRSRF